MKIIVLRQYFNNKNNFLYFPDDLDTFSRRRGRMEMVGNLAISAEQLASASADGGGEGKHEYPPEEKEGLSFNSSVNTFTFPLEVGNFH